MVFKVDYVIEKLASELSGSDLELFIALCIAIMIVLAIIILSIIKKLKD